MNSAASQSQDQNRRVALHHMSPLLTKTVASNFFPVDATYEYDTHFKSWHQNETNALSVHIAVIFLSQESPHIITSRFYMNRHHAPTNCFTNRRHPVEVLTNSSWKSKRLVFRRFHFVLRRFSLIDYCRNVKNSPRLPFIYSSMLKLVFFFFLLPSHVFHELFLFSDGYPNFVHEQFIWLRPRKVRKFSHISCSN